MNQEDIESMFARLDQRIAQVDAQLALTRRAVARLEAVQAVHVEHTAAEIQAAAQALDDAGERVTALESRAAVADAGLAHLAARVDAYAGGAQ